MAYDQHSAYQPPSRGYNGQRTQQAPVQTMKPRQPAYNHVAHQQGYDYGYDQNYGYDGAHGYNGGQLQTAPIRPMRDPRQPLAQQRQYPQGYTQSYDQWPEEEYHYDVPYTQGQRREDAGYSPVRGQHPYQSPQFAQSMPVQGQYKPQQPIPVDSPRQPAKFDKPLPQPGMLPPPARPSGAERSTSAEHLQPGERQKKSRKPLIEAIPLTLAQDNAFPVFPTTKKPNEKPKSAEFDVGATSGGRDVTRPATADGFQKSHGRPGPPRGSAEQQRRSEEQQRRSQEDQHRRSQEEQQRRSQEQQRIGLQTHSIHQNPDTYHQLNGSHPNGTYDQRDGMQSRQDARQPQDAQWPQPARPTNNVPRKQMEPNSGHIAAQALPSRSVRPRPPPPERDESVYGAEQDMTPSNRQAPRHGHSSSLSEMYADYYGNDLLNTASNGDERDRDAEIEAEMPDFDNAGPVQSAAHRRGLTIDQHLDSAPSLSKLPALPENAEQNIYSHGPQSVSTPDLRQRGPAKTSTFTDFQFGVPPTAQRGPGYNSRPQPPQHVTPQVDAVYGHEAQMGNHQQGPGRNDPRLQAQRRGPPQSVDAYGPPQGRGFQRPDTSMTTRTEPSVPTGGYPAHGRQVLGPQRPGTSMTTRTEPVGLTGAYGAQSPQGLGPPRPGTSMTSRTEPMAPAGVYATQGFQGRDPQRPGTSMTSRTDTSTVTTRTATSSATVRTEPPTGLRGPSPAQRPSPPRSSLDQQKSPNPDALPHHALPARKSLDDRRSPPAHSAAAIRQYNNGQAPARSSIDERRQSQPQPVTLGEINQLQAQVNAHPQDAKTALLLAKKLVEAASVLASENGRLDARATAKNREKYILDAHRRVKKLVNHGYPEAMFYLADCYGQGALGLEVDTKEAFTLYQSAAKAGHAQAAYRTAVCCEMGPDEGGGTRRDIQKAVQWYRRAAQLQDVAAMYKLGIILLKGLLGQPKNVAEAVTWLKRAAERADKANPHALHELGVLYEPENPDPDVRAKIIPDEKYARELFQKAAGLGYKASQARLGQAYEYGALGLPIDARGSIAWYSKAAAQGDHLAELALSGWYLTGAEGILEHSDAEAYLWARKAATSEPPLPKAMFAMGYYTETGIGCSANMEEAKKWYGRAASYRFPKAIERLEELRKGGHKAPKPELKGARLQRRDQKRDDAECSIM